MKTFLDRFRRKEKGDEPSEGVADLFGNGGAAETKVAGVADNGGISPAKPAGIILTPVPSRTSDDHVRLELGDFLHRIPQNLLRAGPHDVTTGLLFNINELSSLIANGHTTINLVEIHRRVPDVFRSSVKAEDKIEIRFPWQKLMHLVKAPTEGANTASGITPAAAEALAQKIRSRRPARSSLATASPTAEKTPATPTTPAFRDPGEEKPAAPAKSGAPNAQQLSWFSKPGSEILPAASLAPAENPPGFNRDDIIRARDAATLKLAGTKAEFERQTEHLAAERENIAGERDRAVEELSRAKAELAAKIQQIEQHENLGAQQAQETSGTIAQRDALQQEVTAKDGQLAALTAELAALKNGGAEAAGSTAQERNTLLAGIANFRRELAEKNEQVEFHQSMGAKSAEDAARLATEREALQGEVTAKAAELEALRHELQEMRKGGEKIGAVAEERESIRAELVRARQELAAKIEEIETQKSLADSSVEEVAAAKSDCKSLQRELAEKSSQLESLAAELATHKKGGTEKISAIEQERNSLLQLKTKLTNQLAEATAGLASKQKAVVERDLSRKENQRHLDEMQRRIAAFESGQRATAQELTRERETRIKAERSLAAADRARQEASALIESMRSDTKRESDSATRKREADYARTQKELQDRIEALTEANRKAVAERDERIQEIQKVRAEAGASVEAIQSSVRANAEKGAQWESRAIAGMEEDIAKYRDRIKAVLGERDAATATAKAQIEELTRARDLAAQELEKTNAAAATSAADQASAMEELRAKVATFEKEKTAIFEDLDQTRQALAQRGEQLAAAQAQAESGGTAAAELRQQLEKLGADATGQAALLASHQSASGETAQKLEAQEKLAAELRAEIANLKAALDTTAVERAALNQRIDEVTTRLEQAKAEDERQISDIRAAHKAQLESQRASSDDLAEMIAEHAATVAGLNQQLEESKSAQVTLTNERGNFQKDLDAAMALLDQARAEHDAQIATLQAGHSEALSKQQANA
ncbi:MAG: hypothetical protein ABIZ56_05990, partial [Chthoniobacteraceae bacterium]